jgi:ferrochelatase
MKLGVILLNFGEPEHATSAEVVPFLERIFITNAALEGDADAAQVQARSRQLAERRAPGLIAEYEEIGGSPLNAQARMQADALAGTLRERGHDAWTWVGYQFTHPDIREAAQSAFDAGVTHLVGLPVYPLCGHSTTVAALRELAEIVDGADADVDYREISGWHAHDLYLRLRADGILGTVSAAGIDLNDAESKLVFSAHGTPVRYLREGNRYDRYVEDCCRRIAELAGARDYVIGYQNHTNRPVEWTQPDIEAVVHSLDARDVVVVPVSFMHEQSETLAELDHDLRAMVEARGSAFHRVPVPHDDPRFAEVMADLVEAILDNASGVLRSCVCRPTERTRCTNGDVASSQ